MQELLTNNILRAIVFLAVQFIYWKELLQRKYYFPRVEKLPYFVVEIVEAAYLYLPQVLLYAKSRKNWFANIC